MGATLPTRSLKLGLKTKLGKKICLPAVLGAAVIVALVQYRQLFHNHFSVSPRIEFHPSVFVASMSLRTNGSTETILTSNFCAWKSCTEIPKKEDIGTHSDEDIQLPTRPLFKNENLYQKDATQQLNSTWVRNVRVCNFKMYKQYT